MNDNEKTRMCLYLEHLSRQSHIESRRLFADYKRQLENDTYLTVKQVDHLFPFIKRDTTMSPNVLREYLQQFVKPSTELPNTLEQFFE